MKSIAEHDWKYFCSIYEQLREELARRINDEVRQVLANIDLSENEKRERIFELVLQQNKIVAFCFDGWRRNTLHERCWALQKHNLLRAEHLVHLTPEFRRRLEVFVEALEG